MLRGNQLERLFPFGCRDLKSHEKLETEADSEDDVWEGDQISAILQ